MEYQLTRIADALEKISDDNRNICDAIEHQTDLLDKTFNKRYNNDQKIYYYHQRNEFENECWHGDEAVETIVEKLGEIQESLESSRRDDAVEAIVEKLGDIQESLESSRKRSKRD